jgi:hypothetical protein
MRVDGRNRQLAGLVFSSRTDEIMKRSVVGCFPAKEILDVGDALLPLKNDRIKMVIVGMGDEDPDREILDLFRIDPAVFKRQLGWARFRLLSIPRFLVVKDKEVVARPDCKSAMAEIPDGSIAALGDLLVHQIFNLHGLNRLTEFTPPARILRINWNDTDQHCWPRQEESHC